MYLPGLKSVSKTTDSVVRWLGYNHNDAPAEGSFYDCQNICFTATVNQRTI